MADKKTGPVKPPILDMKARQAGSGTPEAEKSAPATADTKASDSEKPKSEQTLPKPEKAGAPQASGTGPKAETKSEPGSTTKPKTETDKDGAGTKPATSPPPPAPPKRPGMTPDAQPTRKIGDLVVTALAGGIGGLALAYGLALGGLWPQPEQGVDEDIVAGLETRIAQLEATNAEGATSGGALAERLEALEAGLSDAAASIAALGETAPAPASEDFASLAETVTALSERVEALGSAAAGDTLGTPAPEVGEIEARLAALETDYQDTLAQMQALTQASRSADDRLADLETRIADQADFDALNAERERLVQLPGALSALETAIASGDAFANELSAVAALSPGLEPDADGLAAAASGVKSPRTLLAEFRVLIPDLIAARPDQGEAGWFDTLLDQASAAIALRPTGEGGDSAAALVGRTETALDTGDLAGAREIIALYPPDMAEIAQPIADDIGAHIAARQVLAAAQDPVGPGEVTQ